MFCIIATYNLYDSYVCTYAIVSDVLIINVFRVIFINKDAKYSWDHSFSSY